MLADLISVGLFFLGDDYCCAEQAVADTVTFTAPCYPVIDDVGIHRAILADLANFNPAIRDEHINSALYCSAAALHQGRQSFLADDYRIMLSNPCG